VVASGASGAPADAVARLGAVQAQDYLGALWAVGLRSSATESEVERALAEGHIVRTWPMRGTLHFVAAADARWLTELLAPRAVAAGASRMRALGIDAALLRRARSVLTRALTKARSLPRPEIYRVLEDAGIATAAQRGLHLLWRLAQECFVCFGPRIGKQPSFVLFDDWVAPARALRGDEALAELAARYFEGHGPATVRDLAWWSGLTLATARRAVHAAGDHLRPAASEGQEYFCGSKTPASVRARGGAHVLPAFDELLVGYALQGTFVDGDVKHHVRAGGLIHPVVVAGDRVAGIWRRRLGAREVACSVRAFEPLDAPTLRAVRLAFERYARFLGRALRFDGVNTRA
jgi:hypothetical protein